MDKSFTEWLEEREAVNEDFFSPDTLEFIIKLIFGGVALGALPPLTTTYLPGLIDLLKTNWSSAPGDTKQEKAKSLYNQLDDRQKAVINKAAAEEKNV
jgi:hypothetical protein